jgi:pyruvate dehydrogenase E2 component (dihydrolipoamide acetyltransferase)
MEEGQLSRWLKKEGDTVSMGEPIAEIDTDKATMEMQALGSGVLRKILINEGDVAPLGQLIAVIADPDEDISSILSEAKSGKIAPASTDDQPAKQEEPTPPDEKPAEPEVEAAPSQPENGAGQVSSEDKSGRLVVSPLAARMAAEAGINLRNLSGSGPGGRIVKRDIEAAMKAPQAQPASKTASIQVRRQQPILDTEVAEPSAYRDAPMSEMRRVIAKRLVTSIGPVPHFFLTTEIEMDKAAEARALINDLNPESKISLNDLIIKVAALSLIQHPQVNSSFQEKAVRYYEHADIGVAVAVEEGLITPIVRSADRKGVLQIGAEVRELAGRARSRKLRPEEYTGATFSVSNLGMFGIEEFTAIINPPEAAILAVGAMSPKPVVRDGNVVIRQMMRVTMSCDHRVIDGATGARFLQTLKQLLENPLSMVVDYL